MLPSAPTSARINLPNTATGFDLLDSCTILAAHIPGTTSSCTLSRLGLPHCSFMSSLRLVVSSICCTLLLLPPTISTLFTFLAMSTLPAYFILVAALILSYSAHVLYSSYCHRPISRDSIFSLCPLSFVYFAPYCSCLVHILFCLLIILLFFSPQFSCTVCPSLLVYHRFATTCISSANHRSRIYAPYISGLGHMLALNRSFHARDCSRLASVAPSIRAA